MLALKLGLSLVSTRKLGSYVPPSIESLEAWYQFKEGITLNGSTVSAWSDSSNNEHNMVQATETEQPVNDAGTLEFISADLKNLQIKLEEDFTLGLRIRTDTINGAFLSDNTTSNEYFKYATSSRIAFRLANSVTKNLDLDSGTFGDDYIVITRASDVFTLWKNGVAQTGTTPTVAGTCLIDVIGLRKADNNAFDGFIKEIMIYTISNATLTGQINTRLASL